MDRVAFEAIDRRENFGLERSHEWHKFGETKSEGIDPIGVTINRDVKASECRGPKRRKMIAIKVGEAEGADVSRADTGAVETLCECARADAGVDKQDAARRPDNCCVSFLK